MQVYGVDLAVWYAAGRWVGLLDLIDGLPAASRFNEARLNDPEEAARIAAQLKAQESDGEQGKLDRSPPMAHFDQTASMLAEMIDLMKDLISTTVSAAGGKPGKAEPYPRPRTRVQDELAKIEIRIGGDLMRRWGFNPDDI